MLSYKKERATRYSRERNTVHSIELILNNITRNKQIEIEDNVKDL
jgi:hypothetical protein